MALTALPANVKLQKVRVVRAAEGNVTITWEGYRVVGTARHGFTVQVVAPVDEEGVEDTHNELVAIIPPTV